MGDVMTAGSRPVHKGEPGQAMGAVPDGSDSFKRVPCLRGLNPAILGRIQAMAREKRLRRGELLFQEGATCEEISLITEGSIKVYRLSDDGRQHTLWVLGAGDCFCLAPFFHQARYPFTAECMTDVRIVRLGRESCQWLVKAEPEVAPAVVGCLSERLTALVSLFEVVSAREVRRRLARILLDLARSRGVKTQEGILLDAGLTHDELAACAGTVREVVSRTLEQFQREGLVRLGRRRLLIPDLSNIQAITSARRHSKR
jgi:CRP/FNR family transcriptional regulator